MKSIDIDIFRVDVAAYGIPGEYEWKTDYLEEVVLELENDHVGCQIEHPSGKKCEVLFDGKSRYTRRDLVDQIRNAYKKVCLDRGFENGFDELKDLWVEGVCLVDKKLKLFVAM